MTKQDLHLHTDFSDGQNTPAEMVEAACDCGLREICFADHVRRDSSWWSEYESVCAALERKWRGKVSVRCGVEAKICDFHGQLDVPADLSPAIVQVAAIHRLPLGDGSFRRRTELRALGDAAVECWFRAIEGLAENPRADRLAHPFSLLPDMAVDMNGAFWDRVVSAMEKGAYRIEYNRRYDNDFVPDFFWRHFQGRVVVGSDSHSAAEMYQNWK